MPAETKVQTQAEADEKMVDIPNEGSSVDVEIKDTPTAVTSDDDSIIDVGEKEVVAASESEVEDYGRKVQSRIDKLTKKVAPKKKAVKKVPKVQKAGRGTSKEETAAEALKAKRTRLRKSGKQDDAASLFYDML